MCGADFVDFWAFQIAGCLIAFLGMDLYKSSLLLAVSLSLPTLWAKREYTDEQVAFWEDEAFPVLEENCWKCHGISKKIRGGLVLTTLEGVLKGESLDHLLI